MKGHISLLIRLLEIASTLQQLPTFFFTSFFFNHRESLCATFVFFSGEVIIETSNDFAPLLVEKQVYDKQACKLNRWSDICILEGEWQSIFPNGSMTVRRKILVYVTAWKEFPVSCTKKPVYSQDNTIRLAIIAVHKWGQGTIRVSCACGIATLTLTAYAAQMNERMSSFERCLGLVIPHAA